MYKILFSRFFYSAILSLILISAISGNVDQLFYSLQTLGLNIPMTPFTYDMGYMLGRDSHKEAYYNRSFFIEYQTHKETADLAVGPLGFYEFKAPFQWIAECQVNHNPCTMLHYYLCHSLNHYTKSRVITWRMKERGIEKMDEVSGVGVPFTCHQ